MTNSALRTASRLLPPLGLLVFAATSWAPPPPPIAEAEGGIYSKAGDWPPYVITDGLLITGQNPASSGPGTKALLDPLTKKFR